MQCAVDGEASPTSEDFAEPQDWVLRHCGQNPSHRSGRRSPTAGARRPASAGRP
ncbi:DUF7848 domain-containing protein [Streptomyces sp. NBC_00464]|uniref:DUF7848 domain-containing protein n=1 Tax=Streptomyces sp. NBC_00464 TaxID=2975751 RepID=UPI003FA72072